MADIQTTKCDSEDKITWLRPIAETIMVMTVENCIVMVLLWSDRIGLFVFCVFVCVCAVWLVVVWLLWWGLISHRLAALYYPTFGLQKSKESLRKFTYLKYFWEKCWEMNALELPHSVRFRLSLQHPILTRYKKESWTEWRLLCPSSRDNVHLDCGKEWCVSGLRNTGLAAEMTA